MTGAVVTGSFVMAAVGAYYLLGRRNEDQGRIFLRTGVIAALISTVLMAFPTGDGRAATWPVGSQSRLPPLSHCIIPKRVRPWC